MRKKSGKSIAQRIRLDYHQDRGWLDWSRWACGLAALLAAAIYGWFVVSGDLWKNLPGLSPAAHLSTGPLSTVHAHFENDCQACHSSNTWVPIAHDAFQPNPAQTLRQLDAACQKCHSVASHVANSSADSACQAMDRNCSNCHRDHRGRDVDLEKVASSECTACHRDLAKICGPGGSGIPIENVINDFSLASHRVFRSLKQDNGRIKFDHSQHLRPGQVEDGRLGKFTLEMLGEKWRGKYRTNDPAGVVQLECRDCHLLHSPDGPRDYTQPSDFQTAGSLELASHYEPINYDQHCAACHELTYAGQTEKDLPLPHAATRDEMEVMLAAKLTGGQVTGRIRMRSEQADPEFSQPKTEFNLQARVDEVGANCVKCHQPADVTTAAIVERRSQKFSEPLIPAVWFAHSFYNHGAHEKVTECSFCHEVTSFNTDSKPTDNEHVMIKGAESCVPCHRKPAYEPEDPLIRRLIAELATDSGRAELLGTIGQPVQASDACTLCHRYHWSRPSQYARLSTSGAAE